MSESKKKKNPKDINQSWNIHSTGASVELMPDSNTKGTKNEMLSLRIIQQE